MNCPNCGAPVDPGQKFCTSCGADLSPSSSVSASAAVTAPPAAGRYGSIPEKYRPLSPWAYVGLSILFVIPLVGFICLIVFSFSDGNINRRNYARSFWCALLICLIISIALYAFLAVNGGAESFLESIASLY